MDFKPAKIPDDLAKSAHKAAHALFEHLLDSANPAVGQFLTQSGLGRVADGMPELTGAFIGGHWKDWAASNREMATSYDAVTKFVDLLQNKSPLTVDEKTILEAAQNYQSNFAKIDSVIHKQGTTPLMAASEDQTNLKAASDKINQLIKDGNFDRQPELKQRLQSAVKDMADGKVPGDLSVFTDAATAGHASSLNTALEPTKKIPGFDKIDLNAAPSFEGVDVAKPSGRAEFHAGNVPLSGDLATRIDQAGTGYSGAGEVVRDPGNAKRLAEAAHEVLKDATPTAKNIAALKEEIIQKTLEVAAKQNPAWWGSKEAQKALRDQAGDAIDHAIDNSYQSMKQGIAKNNPAHSSEVLDFLKQHVDNLPPAERYNAIANAIGQFEGAGNSAAADALKQAVQSGATMGLPAERLSLSQRPDREPAKPDMVPQQQQQQQRRPEPTGDEIAAQKAQAKPSAVLPAEPPTSSTKSEPIAQYGADLFEHPAVGADLAKAASVAEHSGVLAKLAGMGGHVLKVAGPALIAVAIAAEANAADRAVKEGRLSSDAAIAYKALVTTGLSAGILDPTFGAASDAGLNEAFKKFADANNLDQKTREELNPTLSAMFNTVVLTPEQQRFLNHYESLPVTTDPSSPPEINKLIEIKQKIEQITTDISKADGKLHGPEEAGASKEQQERLDKLKADYAESYMEAAKKDPKFLSSLDQSADINSKAVELAKDPKIQAEANALIDTLPKTTSPDQSPQTNRLIEARNALLTKIADLEKAEKADLAAGKPVLGYYGKKIDDAVQGFVDAYAKEKTLGTAPVQTLPAQQQPSTPTTPVGTIPSTPAGTPVAADGITPSIPPAANVAANEAAASVPSTLQTGRGSTMIRNPYAVLTQTVPTAPSTMMSDGRDLSRRVSTVSAEAGMYNPGRDLTREIPTKQSEQAIDKSGRDLTKEIPTAVVETPKPKELPNTPHDTSRNWAVLKNGGVPESNNHANENNTIGKYDDQKQLTAKVEDKRTAVAKTGFAAGPT